MQDSRNYLISGTILFLIVGGFFAFKFYSLKSTLEHTKIYANGSTQTAYSYIRSATAKAPAVLVNNTDIASFLAYQSPVEGISSVEFMKKVKDIGRFDAARDGGKRLHTGFDIPAPEGTDLIAMSDATILFTGPYSKTDKGLFVDYGNTVVFKMDDGSIISYSHMQDNSFVVKAGDVVKKGTIVGKVGMTGDLEHATGAYKYAHVHVEWFVSGATFANAAVTGTLIDPEKAVPLIEGQQTLDLIKQRATRI